MLSSHSVAHPVLCSPGQYYSFVIENKDWEKATGKDRKLTKHESSYAHKSAADASTARKNSPGAVASHLSRAYAELLERDKKQKEENRATCDRR